MTQGFDVEALGVGLRIEVDGMSRADFRRLRAQWRRVSGAAAPSATVSVSVGVDASDADVVGRDVDDVSVTLRQLINLRAIERRRQDLLMLHAAGLADPATGDVIALIGPSGAGKTTAASSLGTVLGYVSDETVAVDADGGVLPFPKPLALKQRDALGKRVVGPDALGLEEVRRPLRLSRLALLDRRDEYVTPTVATVGLEDALGRIIEQTSYLGSLPGALQRLEAVVRVSGGVHVLRYHHAADLVEPVSELLRRPAAHLPLAEVHAAVAPAAAPGHIAPGSYTRAHIDDSIEVGGEVIVLVDGKVSRFSPLGSVLWAALHTPMTRDGLIARAETAFGPAPDGSARNTVQAVLDELADAGLVRRLGSDESLGDNDEERRGEPLPGS
jgi:energy-coupling factor transporter ATP-binding protein EcfA2